MYLLHESTIKNTNGVIEITVIIVNKPVNFKKYTYKIGSEYAARAFHNLYRKGRKLHGKALALLNEWKLEEERNA